MKTILKKTVALTAAVALSVTMLAGCGAGNEGKNEQGQTVISVGGWPDKEGANLDRMNARKARFEEANADAVIEPDLWKFDRKTFYPKAAGGQLPTVFGVGFTEMPEVINSGYSADLTEAMTKYGYNEMINESVLKIISDEEGRVKAFPTNAYLLGLAFNTEMLEAAGLMEADGTPKQPKDWNEVVEFAVKIKEATGKPGFILPTADRSGGWIFTSIAWSFGVDFMEKGEDGKWKATFNTPEAAEALQWYKDLKWKYDVVPTNTLINAEEWYKNFGIGNAGITVTAGDYPGKVVKYGMTPDQVGMMGIPAGPKRHVTLLGGDVQCLKNNATEEQIDAGVRWIQTGYSYNLTDEYKKTTEENVAGCLEENRHVGIHAMSTWSDKSESLQWYRSYLDEMNNSNPNHVRLYNEFVAACPVEVQPEEPICCQELYAILDGCIQEVWTNENADPAELLEKANADFQTNYLDNISY